MRHAAHALLPHTLAGRTPNVPLSAEGEAQAARLAAFFAESRTSAIVTSPIQRARETAAPIGRRLGVPPVLEPGFEEIDFGGWTGRRFDDLGADPAWQSWNRFRSLSACPGGESMHHAQSRALAALAHWRALHFGQTVIVVSHADILKALLAPALGLPLDRLHRLTIDPAGISTIVMFDDDLRVDCINAVAAPLPPQRKG